MTVNTVSPAIISRAEFNLNAGQTKTPPLVRMDFGNLVTNGGFDTDTDWIKGTGWTISGGTANAAGVTSDGQYLEQAFAWNLSRYYFFSMTTGGTVNGSNYFAFRFGGTSDVSPTANTAGAYTNNFYPGGNGNLRIRSEASANNLTIENVSIYEADPSDDAPWLRLPYGYSVGRTGIIVRDGVILHPSDYTEIKDSGQTWIKPIVAPGVSTEFSIWGSAS